MEEICLLCCAGKRDAECGDCPHYVEARKYEDARRSPAPTADKHFTVLIDPKVEAAVNAALELAERGDVRRAEDTLTRLLREYPRDHQVRFGLGTLHAMKGEYREAIRYFDQTIEIFPYDVDAHYNRAAACQQVLDLTGAIRGFREVVAMGDPDDTTVKKAQSNLDYFAATIRKTEGVDLEIFLQAQEAFNRAFALLEQGDWLRALAGFRASAAKHDRNAPTHGNLALCLARLGRKREALAELDRALEINPDYEPAKLNRVAVEQMEEGRPMTNVAAKSIDYSREKVLRERGR
jgi:tetratricopeptide (TPR) repeat protein